MIFKNQKIQKFLAALVLVAILATPMMIPRKADALFGVGDISFDPAVFLNTLVSKIQDVIKLKIKFKEILNEILNKISKKIAMRALTRMTESTVTWINSGFHGKPLFLQNPDTFFGDITKFEIRKLVDVYGYNSSRYPFGKQWSLDVINAYKGRLQNNASYSLSNLIQDEVYLNSYRSNFAVGGWNGFLLQTQYPENNYIGFTMLANEELARRLNTDPNANNEIGKVKTTLQQGLGFLSPQTCSSNPGLTRNPYAPPDFKFNEEYKPPEVFSRESYMKTDANTGLRVPDDAAYLADVAAKRLYDSGYNSRKGISQINWTNNNTCTGGWVNTTPGSVVAGKITEALNVPENQTGWKAVIGGSLASIFDSLLNKFLGSGLDALASKINPPAEKPDNWDYLGNTLGSPATYNPYNDSPFGGPDEVIVLDEFKTAVDQGIAATREELALLDNPNSIQYGAIQYLSAIWPKVRQLDICLPGPNYKWEERFDEDIRNTSMNWNKKAKDDGEKLREVGVIIKELQFAADFFKDWIRNQMITSLPSAFFFLDTINETEANDTLVMEIVNAKRLKAKALPALIAIQGALNSEEFNVQPEAGTPAEKRLIDLKKQYNIIAYSISNSDTIEEARAQLKSLINKLSDLNSLTAQCATERKNSPDKWNLVANWDDPYGTKSFKASEKGKNIRVNAVRKSDGVYSSIIMNYTTSGTEREQFCSLPVLNGYTHEMFVNAMDPREGGTNVIYPEIPRVAGAIRTETVGSSVILFNCNDIFRSYPLDYKGNIPGQLTIDPPPPADPLIDSTPDGGTPPPGTPCDPATDPSCVPAGCGGTGQIACT
ncbi:MAG: hypothetical protein AAB500_00830 [Patescibacteria group bacterium]